MVREDSSWAKQSVAARAFLLHHNLVLIPNRRQPSLSPESISSCRMASISAGGSRPSLSALSQRSTRLIPRHGPNLTSKSNMRSASLSARAMYVRTSTSGRSPSRFARSHRSSRVRPEHGP
ncbi:unnamed protein product [Chondrus crispus]|uniref:Uncharacterized protein n=1 Tax=Chondrus crispus TaxID=2769 RepID=R7Q7H2_CHOCR|nr:unnamed protein product [Chondrus crispus]CDF33783.1 unnamed protein product [Chondrus crispus]|eukprot:XP_005713602.1 unnamed protein product [Chondrus crispus]